MQIQDSLFEGKFIRLSSIDHEKDAEIETIWTHDAEYMRMLSPAPFYPLSVAQIKKRYEAIEKEAEESHSLFYFTLRNCSDDRLVGFARLYWIDWTNSNGNIQLGIGNPADRRRGYGGEALRLLLRYAFSELNLYRLTAVTFEYNTAALGLFQKAGFIEEVRRRQAVNRDNQRWDVIHLGILRSEWQDMKGGSL